MTHVGITGGIGTGKTMVCNVFMQLGIPVFNADIEARILMESDLGIKNALTDLLGKDIYSGNIINRKKMAVIIFNDSGLRKKVNEIVHPLVAKSYMEWSLKYKGFPYIIQESALLFESRAFKKMDYIITVTAPEELRIQRVLLRPGMNRQIIQKIMDSQLPEEYKINNSDFVINNDQNVFIIPQVVELHKKLYENRKDHTNLKSK